MSGDRATLWLIGMMGTGKSTVGRLVAVRSKAPFVDLDEAIEAAEGRTIPEIFAAAGEDAFRAVEADAVEGVAGRPVVVATGGGAVTRPGVAARMRRSGTVVWLDASPSLLLERVGSGDGRPMLEGDPRQRLEELAARRAPAYRAAAHHRVEVGGRSPEEIADEVAGLWTRS